MKTAVKQREGLTAEESDAARRRGKKIREKLATAIAQTAAASMDAHSQDCCRG
jgi:hypothetical protein